MRIMLLAAPLLLLAACGGGSAAPSGPTEESLRETAQAFGDTLTGDGGFLSAYSYYHQDFRDKCSSDDYIARMLFAMGLLLGDDYDKAEYKVQSVSVDGERGEVVGDFIIDGRDAGSGSGDDSGYWVWDDGKWWVNDSDPTPCD